jgi:hypothetical protein
VFYRLKSGKVLNRITMAMQALQIKYPAFISAELISAGAFVKTREHLLLNVIKDTDSVTNRYALMGDIGAPDSLIMVLPIFNETDLDEAVRELGSKVKGMKLKSSIITNVIVGSLCFRRFDNAYSIQHRTLVREHNMVPRPTTSYDDTENIKKKYGMRGELLELGT